VPLRFDDGFRGTIAIVVAAPLMVLAIVNGVRWGDSVALGAVIGFAGLSLTLFSLVYVIWTHQLFHATPPQELDRIAAEQYRRGPSRLERWMGFAGTESWAMWAAIASILVAMATAFAWYSDRSLWLPLITIVTAASSWVTMAYAFALRYLRLNAAGEDIEFEIRETPTFSDYLSMSFLIATVAALSAGAPRTRAGLRSVRAQTIIAFVFNSLVIAMIVSLVLGLLNAG
jgi:uncharacterized membrane protein